MVLKPSRTRIGPYEIVGLLGIGSIVGEIFKARDVQLDCAVVIRALWIADPPDPQLRASVAREIEILAAHPHITGVHGVAHDNGRDYLVLEYWEHETLAERVRRGPIKIDEARKIAIEIAEALDAAHRLGLIHRNLKPANVLLTKTGVQLFDFGLPTLRSQVKDWPRIKVAATAMGPLIEWPSATVSIVQYMSPEQLQGQEADARSDIWSLGCVIYAMLAGQPPFLGTHVESVIDAVLSTEPDVLPNTRANARVAPIVTKCLRKSAMERWQNARDAALALRMCNTGRWI
jgi:serine/threonine protein kinase